jgi:hypothetical protein
LCTAKSVFNAFVVELEINIFSTIHSFVQGYLSHLTEIGLGRIDQVKRGVECLPWIVSEGVVGNGLTRKCDLCVLLLIESLC